MPDWQPDLYLLFEKERTQPCRDLVARIASPNPRTVIDLGCGPGNSTAVLAERWPSARITVLDSSSDMLARAAQNHPRCERLEAGIADWAGADGPAYDLVFSNAALQWVDRHAEVYPRLLARVSPGGALAIQVPANINAPAHRLMRDLAGSAAWRDYFPPEGVREWFVHDAAFYYDLLAPISNSLALWETIYLHTMPTADAIVEWYKSTGLRPFLDHLDDDADRARFLADYTAGIRGSYEPQGDGRVLFPFARLFLIAGR